MLLFLYKNTIIQRQLQINMDDSRNKKKIKPKNYHCKSEFPWTTHKMERIIVLYLALDKPCIIYGDLDLGTLL